MVAKLNKQGSNENLEKKLKIVKNGLIILNIK